MRSFHLHQNHYWLEQVSLTSVAEQYGTPLYVYSTAAINEAWQEWRDGLSLLNADRSSDRTAHDAVEGQGRPQLSFAVKANSNLSILRLLNQLGSGFDVVSGGELQRALSAGVLPWKILYSGTGKSEQELRLACAHKIACINIESWFEYRMIEQVLLEIDSGSPLNLAVRINPEIEVDTHAYITTGSGNNKFGLPTEEGLELAEAIAAHPKMHFAGMVCHIGSQICDPQPYCRALSGLLDGVAQLTDGGIATPLLGLGGGWGVAYTPSDPRPPVTDLMQALRTVIDRHPVSRALPDLTLAFEPGRSIVAEAGMLLTKVLGIKQTRDKKFAILDASMTECLRPSLYQAQHAVVNLNRSSTTANTRYDLVGPVCETGDFLALDYPIELEAGDLLGLLDTGAYGYAMSSNYNSRPRPAEVLIDGAHSRLISRRQRYSDLIADEYPLLVQ